MPDLNIWSPAKSADEKLPVLSYFYGGGYQAGDPHGYYMWRPRLSRANEGAALPPAFFRIIKKGRSLVRVREKPIFGVRRISEASLDLSRRGFFLTASAVAGDTLVQGPLRAAIVKTDTRKLPAYGNSTLPAGIRSRTVNNSNGLAMHMLEAGFEVKGRPCLLLLHGFPELAYSWRNVMLPLAAAGFHVVAPDQRGYGRTTGWDDDYDGDLESFRLPNLVRDALGLVFALGYRTVAAVIGHDFGSPVAAYCVLWRPDVFHSVVLMSAPFAGPPLLPFDTAVALPGPQAAPPRVDDDLARLRQPRKYYQWYYSTREANENMRNCPQGIHAFLRAYYHYKSADWKQNKPFRLASFTASELAKMPAYYIMDLNKGMAETVASEMPSAADIAACKWLTEAELSVYSSEFARTGFQGGLQWYRCRGGKYTTELEMFSGRTINVPACFIAGKSDWGAYQSPGALEKMQTSACTQMLGTHLIEGAGHWVQQEQPEEVSRLLIEFLKRQDVGR